MDDLFEKLKEGWEAEKQSTSVNPEPSIEVIKRAKLKSRKAILNHVQIILIMAVTLLAISLFFVFYAPMQDILSRIGIFLMIGTLVFRILIEIQSINQVRKIDFSASTKKSTDAFRSYHERRKLINGPIMYTILALYTIGFFILTPEFSRHFTTTILLLINFSYIIGAGIVTISIRVGLRSENKLLKEIHQLQNTIDETA